MTSPAYSPNFYSPQPNSSTNDQPMQQVNDFTSGVSYVPRYATAPHQQTMFEHPPPPLPLFHTTAPQTAPGSYCVGLPYFAPQYIVPTVVRTPSAGVGHTQPGTGQSLLFPATGGAQASFFFCAPNVQTTPNYTASANFGPLPQASQCSGNRYGYGRSGGSSRYAVKFTTKTSAKPAVDPDKQSKVVSNGTDIVVSCTAQQPVLIGQSSVQPINDATDLTNVEQCKASSAVNVELSSSSLSGVNGFHQKEGESSDEQCTVVVTAASEVVALSRPATADADVQTSATTFTVGNLHGNDTSTNSDIVAKCKQTTTATINEPTKHVVIAGVKSYSERVASSLLNNKHDASSVTIFKPVDRQRAPKPNSPTVYVDAKHGVAPNTASQTEFPPVRDVNSSLLTQAVENGNLASKSDTLTILNTTDITYPEQQQQQNKPSAPGKSWASLFNSKKSGSTIMQSVDNVMTTDPADVVASSHQPEQQSAATAKSSIFISTATFDDISSRNAKYSLKAVVNGCEVAAAATTTLPRLDVGIDRVACELGTFLQTYTLAHRGFPYQLRGLINPGNWCYVNAALQALIACPPFVHLLRDASSLLPLRSPSITPTLDAMVEFVAEFSEKTNRRGPQDLDIGASFEPSCIFNLLKASQSSNNAFQGREEDAEEFLSLILNNLHEEMSKCMTYGETKSPELEDNDDNGEEWQQVGPNRKAVITRSSKVTTTPVANIFSGLLRNTTLQQQPTGKSSAANLESFFVLPLDIQSDDVTSVQSALARMHKEIIRMSKGKNEVSISRRTTFQELPTVLILQMKYFVCNEEGLSRKLIKHIEYGMDLSIDRTLLTLSGNGNKFDRYSRSYKLFAVVYHHGAKAENGHYTACVFHGGFWVHVDDTRISPVDDRRVLNCIIGDSSVAADRVPYLLFYRRCDSFADRRQAATASDNYRNPPVAASNDGSGSECYELNAAYRNPPTQRRWGYQRNYNRNHVSASNFDEQQMRVPTSDCDASRQVTCVTNEETAAL